MLRKIAILLLIAAAAAVVMIASGHSLAVAGLRLFARLRGRNHPAAQSAAPPVDSGDLYTVQAGDTPISIAKKLHVECGDLLRLNAITDPRKLQVGEKLHVPREGGVAVAKN